MNKFNKEQNGYSVSEVNQFVSEAIVQLETMIEHVKKRDAENADLKSKNKSLTDQLVHYHNIEQSLKQAIISAEESGNNIRKNATEEANLIIREAKQNASRIVNDALIRSERIEIKADTLERNMRIFKRKLKLIVEQQLTIIDEIEDIELK